MKIRHIIAESFVITPDEVHKTPEAWGEVRERLREFIQANCRPWLESYTGKETLYRGIRNVENLAFTRPVRQDRRPRDSDMETHQFFNHVISMAGGVANRSNSAFVTTDSRSAQEYGTVCVVMPVGDFNYTWSPYMQDWYSNELSARSWWDPSLVLDQVPWMKLNKSVGVITGKQITMDNALEVLTHIQTQWAAAGQLAIHAGFPHSCYTVETVTKERGILADQGLEEAMLERHEIMIQAKELLYISLDLYDHMEPGK